MIGISDCTLGEGLQTTWNGNLPASYLEGYLDLVNTAGYHTLEVLVSGSFVSALHGMRENPWERLRIIQRKVTSTPLQATFNVGSLSYPGSGFNSSPQDFLSHCTDNGISVFRFYDYRNSAAILAPWIQAAKAAAGQVQAAIVINSDIISAPEELIELVGNLVDLGIDSLCLQDEFGLLNTTNVVRLVASLKEKFSLPLQLHTHYNGSMALGIYLKGVESGVDYLDAVSSPLAFGLSLPPAESLVYCLKDGQFDVPVNASQLFEIATYLDNVRKELNYPRTITDFVNLKTLGQFKPAADFSSAIEDPELPGNAGLSAEEAALLERQDEENKLTYAWFPKETLEYLTAVIQEEASEPTPADSEALSAEVSDQEVLADEEEETGTMKIKELREIITMLQGTEVTEFSIETSDLKVHIKRNSTPGFLPLTDLPPSTQDNSNPDQLKKEPDPVKTGPEELNKIPAELETKNITSATQIIPVVSPIIGRLYRSASPGNPPFVEVGTRVSPGQTLCIIEAMKVMNEVVAEDSGVVAEILVGNGKAVEYGETILLMAKEVSA